MSIQSVVDYVHHLRTWAVPQALRRWGILEEGYNPKRDRYEHKLLGFTFKSVTFPSMTDLRSITSVPIVGKSGAQYPFVPTTSKPVFLKKKFEVVLPKGEVRRYSTMENLAKDLAKLRRGPTRFASAKSRKMYESLPSDRREIWDRVILKRTGLSLSQSGCDPASIITIRNLRTGACLTRQVTTVDLSVYGYTHGQPVNPVVLPVEAVPVGVSLH